MRSAKDVEAYLGRMNRRFSELETERGTYVVEATDAKLPPVAVRVDPPIVVLRVHVGDVPKDGQGHVELYRRLLTLNARSLVHTSFGLEDDKIVLVSALELENLDYNELEATLDEIEMVLVQQVEKLADLSSKKD
jgi:hypothetical protein